MVGSFYIFLFFFFFQAEDGIRDRTVTGVQTCALPIYRRATCSTTSCRTSRASRCALASPTSASCPWATRSEERRVGKECRCRWWAYHEKKKREKRGSQTAVKE